jgi:hypothetical protein
LKRIVQYIISALLVLIACYGGICWATSSITATGNWSDLTIGASNLAAGAGSNLIDTYQSAADAVSINITDTSGNWGLVVKRDNSTWHPNLHLHIRRTSDGSGSGSISGGNSYQEVTDIDQSFFSGNSDRSNVNVQFELTGVSIQVPPDVYTATVYYTVSDQ